MKSEHIHRKRVSPYVTQPKTLNMIMGHMAGVKVRHALCAGWARAKEMAYTALKLSPIAYALAPSPVTGALAVVNAVDTLIRVRNGDKVGLLEAGLVALSSIQGAAAQTTFTYIGDGKAIAVSRDGNCATASEINCRSVAFGSSALDANGQYIYCSIPGPIVLNPQPSPLPGVPILPIALADMPAQCQNVHGACSPYNAGDTRPVCNTTTPTPTPTPSSTSTAISQTSTGAVASSTPTAELIEPTIQPNVITRPPEPNNDALYAATAAAFGFGFGVGALATCGAAILRSKKAEEEQPDQPARMTSFVRPRLISESSNRSDRSETSDLTISPIYAVIPAAPEYYRMAPVAITLPEPVYAEPNYPPRAIESDYVDMGTVNPYANQTNL